MAFPLPLWLRWSGSLLAAGCVAWLAHRAQALKRSGAWAATLVGGVILAAGGWGWAALLLFFFVTSSLLSRVGRRAKAALHGQVVKGGPRDARQVLANGGLAALAALGHALEPTPWWWLAAAGALAAANADTWATEIGVLSPGPPRDVRTGRPVPPGTSGAVSLLGVAAALLGALGVGLLAAGPLPVALLPVTLGGFLGAWADSLLGATVQARFYCPTCQRSTEHHPRHLCGTPTRLQQGWPWLDNDLVNATATAVGAAVAVGLFALLAGR